MVNVEQNIKQKVNIWSFFPVRENVFFCSNQYTGMKTWTYMTPTLFELPDIVAREPSSFPVQCALPPATFNGLRHCDDVPFRETQLKQKYVFKIFKLHFLEYFIDLINNLYIWQSLHW